MARVLLVDDEEDILWGLSDSLKKEGLEVLTAQDGEEALVHLEDGPIDVMVTDLRMPGMNGVQLLLKAKELQPEINVIVMTAYGSDEIRREVLERGAIHYLEKPFDFEDLYKLIEKCTREKGVEQPWELADVLQLLNLEGRSAIIEVRTEEENGSVFVKDGEPVHSTLGDKIGEKALIAILSQPEIEYNIKFDAPEVERTINSPLYALILRAISDVDESNRDEITSIIKKIGEKEVEEAQKTEELEEEQKNSGEENLEEEYSEIEQKELIDTHNESVKEEERMHLYVDEHTKYSDENPPYSEEELREIIKSIGEGYIAIFNKRGIPLTSYGAGLKVETDERLDRIFSLFSGGDNAHGKLEEVHLRTSNYDILVRLMESEYFLMLFLRRKNPKLGMARIILEKWVKGYAKVNG